MDSQKEARQTMKDNNIGGKMAENFVKHMKGINQ